MPSLNSSKNHGKPEGGFPPARARPTAVISISRKRPTSKATTTSSARVFRSTAEGARPAMRTATSNSSRKVGDPATGKPIGTTSNNLKAAIAGETHEYTDMYPGMARTAREEGFEEIAELVRDARQGRESRMPGAFKKALDTLG